MNPRFLYAPDGSPEPAATPAPASADPAPVEWTGMASQFPREVREKHADLLRGEYKDKKAHEVFEELVDAKGRLSRAFVIPDPKTAKPEDMAAFKKTMGIPDTPEGYELDLSPYKDIQGMEDMAKDFKLRAASMGLTKGQAAKEFEYIANLGKFGAEQQTKAKADHKASFPTRLLEACGGDKAKADEVATRFTAFMAKQVGDPEIIKAMADVGILYSPKFAQAMAKVSKAFDEAPIIEGRRASPGEKGPGMMGNYSPEFIAAAGSKE